MADLGLNIKNMVMKGMEAIGNTASSIASSTKMKVDSYNLQGEKKDLLSAIGEKVVELWKQGEKLPEGLTADVEKVILIEEQLKAMQAENQEQAAPEAEPEKDPEVPAEEEKAPAIEVPAAVEYAAKDDQDIPVIEVESTEEKKSEEASCPLSSAINDLFEQMPPVDKMAEKVNSSLDELGENLRKFSGEFSKGLEKIAEQMAGNDDKKE